MCAPSEEGDLKLPPINETLSKMSFKIRVKGQPEPHEIFEVLMPLSNSLQSTTRETS
jgi:hypothetical protein